MNKNQKIAIIIFVAAIALLGIGISLISQGEEQYMDVPCYDNDGNLIKGLTCESYTFTEETAPFVYGGVLLAMTSICLVFILMMVSQAL